MALCDKQADGLVFHDRTGTLLEQVNLETFDTLTSSHGTAVLNRPGVALARDVPPTDGEGHMPAITEDQTGEANDGDGMADNGDVTAPAGPGVSDADDGDDVEDVGPPAHAPPPAPPALAAEEASTSGDADGPTPGEDATEDDHAGPNHAPDAAASPLPAHIKDAQG